MNRVLLDTQKGVDELCNVICHKGIIALDTEFVRRDTYFAILSLIQLCFDGKIFIVDALRTDVKELWQKIVESDSMILIHSGRQDLEIFYHSFNLLPTNIIDTQIAAKLCGYRAYTSYSELCENTCNVVLDKQHQAGDWLKREISQEMLDYAALDVTYLEPIYNVLQKMMDKKNLGDELQSQIKSSLLDPNLYINRLDDAWKKVKFSNKSELFKKKMQIIAGFREESAKELNIPRRFFATDKHLIQICNMLPTNNQMLRQIAYLKPWIKRSEYSGKLFELCSSFIQEAVPQENLKMA